MKVKKIEYIKYGCSLATITFYKGLSFEYGIVGSYYFVNELMNYLFFPIFSYFNTFCEVIHIYRLVIY